MTPTQAGALLLYAARIDNRLGTLGKEEARGWAEVLDGLDFERCRRAIVKHYQESDGRIMPSHIRALARTTTDGDRGPVVLSPEVEGARGGRAEEPHAGEVLCPRCVMVHRPEESCEEFSRNRRARLPRPIGATVKAITDAPDEGLSGVPSLVHERALQRARAERGNIPWTPPREPAEEGGAPREERDEVDLAPSLAVLAALRDAPARSCLVCMAGPSGRPTFADVPEGRAAHRTVFGHDPRAEVPQRAEGATSGAVD